MTFLYRQCQDGRYEHLLLMKSSALGPVTSDSHGVCQGCQFSCDKRRQTVDQYECKREFCLKIRQEHRNINCRSGEYYKIEGTDNLATLTFVICKELEKTTIHNMSAQNE